MSIALDLALGRELYASETRERMAHAISELFVIRRAAACDADRVLCRLREQEKASRQAGFGNIARLCREMEQRLMAASGDGQSRLAAVAVGVVDNCRTVQLHADAVARGVVRLTGEFSQSG